MIPGVNSGCYQVNVMEKLIKKHPREGGRKVDLVYNFTNEDLVFSSDN